MARKRSSRRRKFNLRKVQIADESTISALAAKDVETFALSGAATNTLRVVSANLMYTWGALAVNDGGCEFGLAHSDYSAAEIEECLEVQTSMDIGNKVSQEQADRLVRRVGTFPSTPNAATTGEQVANEGRPIKTRLNWLLAIGQTLNIWVRNSSGTIWTVNSLLNASGELWVKD